MLVIAGDIVMQLLPDQLNPVYPRVIRWLEKNPEFVIVPQKASCHGALVDDVVVRNQHDSPGPAIVPPELGQQQQENFRVLLLPLPPDDIPRVKPPNSWTLFCTNFMPPLPLGCGQPAPWPGWHNHAAGAANAR